MIEPLESIGSLAPCIIVFIACGYVSGELSGHFNVVAELSRCAADYAAFVEGSRFGASFVFLVSRRDRYRRSMYYQLCVQRSFTFYPVRCANCGFHPYIRFSSSNLYYSRSSLHSLCPVTYRLDMSSCGQSHDLTHWTRSQRTMLSSLFLELPV